MILIGLLGALFVHAIAICMQPADTTPYKIDTPQHFNLIVHNDPTFNNTNTNTNTNYLASFQQQLLYIFSYRHTLQEKAKEQIVYLSDFLKNYIKQNALSLTLGSTALLYASIWARLIILDRRINHPDSWAMWYKSSLEELQGISQELIARELILAIQKKYQSTERLADFISPMIGFIKDIDQEVKNLQSYIWLYDMITKARANSIFPGFRKSVKNAHEKLRKVHYLKNVFSSWMAEYKINLSTSAPAAVGLRSIYQMQYNDIIRKQKVDDLEYTQVSYHQHLIPNSLNLLITR